MSAKKKVLVVDDDEGVRLFIESIMEQQGWETIEAPNGSVALDLAVAHLPTLIILDMTMPVMDGFETFGKLRSNDQTRNIPVIVLTGLNQGRPNRYTPEDLGLTYGVREPEGYVDKPVNPKFLLDCIFGVVG